MKKYTQTQKYLRYMRKRARKEAGAKERFANHRRERNRYASHLKKASGVRIGHRSKVATLEYADIAAPTILSFARNPEEVSKFIQELRQLERNERAVFIVLKDVKEIDYDGILVLLSAVVRFKARKILFNGNFPVDQNVRTTIVESGFFEYINDRFKKKDQYKLEAKKIYTHAKKTVDPRLGEKLIESASKTIWGKPKRCTGLQRVFMELMQNTNNHASFDEAGSKHWWLSVKHIKEERRVVFSFLDYGVGVFNSLTNKRPDHKFYGVLDELYRKLIPKWKHSNCGVLELIFNGELHKTATGKTYRGKGLPGVFQAFKRNKISNLSMITNNVVFNSAKNEYIPLLNEFEGTFISWELTEQNINFD